MCLGHRPAFENVVTRLLDISNHMNRKDDAKVMAVSRQGKDRSVLVARLLMEFRGASVDDVCLDKLLLTWWVWLSHRFIFHLLTM